MNHFEAMIREIDPQLSLHYWNWTQDPTNAPDGQGGFVNLFTPDFMGNAQGEAGDPWRAAGFYDPAANPFRSDNELDPANNPADPPRSITRAVQSGAAPMTTTDDQDAVSQPDFLSFDGAIEPRTATATAQGSGDVATGEPNWGILSPLEPWAGLAAQTSVTGRRSAPPSPERLSPASKP